MTAEDKINPSPAQPITLSPWLVVLGSLLLYGLTLNHWVSLKALPIMAQVTGWDWHPYFQIWRPEAMAPLFLVTTAPIRLLPAAWQPVALNVFAAVCAALTLGLLARSVRLMPFDRTRESRQREMGAHALLSIRASFLPVLFAVLVLATQLTFWENAVVATGEMLNLLVFAFIVNCLLEYRVSLEDKWLIVSAFVYGFGNSNNWALLGFFPIYLITLVWMRGIVGFFNLRFLGRMLLCGVLGNLLYLLVPILAASGVGHGSFASRVGYLLGRELGAQHYGLKLVPGWMALLAGVPLLLPLLFAAIKWPSFEGEISAVGNKLTRFMFGVLHVACLVLVLVTFFDFKYSPSVRMREQPVSFLTFYYLGAMCVGYFSGYMLLVFASIRLPSWERRHPFTKAFNLIMVSLIWVLAFAAPGVLVWQNYPHIRSGNSGVLQQFADQTLKGLPDKTSIVLSDDPSRLFLLQADCERLGQSNKHIMIETESFPHREYILYLAAHYPELKRVMTTNLSLLPNVLTTQNLLTFMQHVTKDYPVYYLHPSFGYYFEALYLKPRGLIYELKPFTTNLTQPPLPTPAEVQANQAFWANLEKGPLQPLPEIARLDSDNLAVSVDYAVALDYWGTELQKAGHLKEAHGQFAEAARLNTNNFIAAINLEYNERLQKGDHRPIDDAVNILERSMHFYGLEPVLRASGPPDEPNLDLELGEVFAGRGNLNQAALLFQRRLQLLPGDSNAELAMAKTYVDLHEPGKARELIHKLRVSSKIDPWNLTRCEAMADIASGSYATAEKALRAAVRADPNDENRIATLMEYYRFRGAEFTRAHKERDADENYANALSNIDVELRLLASPNHDALEVPDTLLKKAELEILLRSYPAAISTLDQVLQMQPKNYTALLNRALSEIQLKRFQAAREDFKALGKLLPKQSYLAEFGLAEVAAAEKDKAEEIHRLKSCIHSAPEESSEFQRATNRLAALEGH